MKITKVLAAFSFTLIVTSCVSMPTEEEIANADYGEFVSTSDCAAVVKPFIANRMKDPDSARFTNFQCYRGWEGNVPIAGVDATYGYRFVGDVNAKNSFGGYTGYTPFSGIVKDRGYGPRVIRYCITSNNSDYPMCIPSMVR